MSATPFPRKLYKFCPWTEIYHRDSLKNNTIYFASIEKFNDTFENYVQICYSNLSSNE